MESEVSQYAVQTIDDPPVDPPPPSPLAHSAEMLAGTLSELTEMAGSEALAQAFGRKEEGSDSDYELDDGYEQLDFGTVLGEEDLREELQRFMKKRLHLRPTQILLRDKLSFVLGTLDLWFSAYWLGRSPETFHQLYTVKAVVLFALRWVIYRLKRWHYYLFDLCYFAQLVLLLQLWVYPDSITWAKVSFALNMGPLLWSIVAFRNSLVYHSLDKVTSHFLHWFPACVSWATRWHPPQALRARLEASPAARERWEGAQFWELSLLPLLPYMLWAVLYYAKVFVISSQRIQQRGYDTLFKHATKNKRSLFGAVVLKFPGKLQPVVYMAMHVLLSAVAMGFNALWWTNYTACTAVIMAVFLVSAWNGASFYFDVFAHRYVRGLGLESRRGPKRSGSHEADTAATTSTASHRKGE